MRDEEDLGPGWRNGRYARHWPADCRRCPPALALSRKHARTMASVHQFARNKRGVQADYALLQEQSTTPVTSKLQRHHVRPQHLPPIRISTCATCPGYAEREAKSCKPPASAWADGEFSTRSSTLEVECAGRIASLQRLDPDRSAAQPARQVGASFTIQIEHTLIRQLHGA